MNASASNSRYARLSPRHMRAMLVGVGACVVTFALAGGLRAAAVSMLPAILMLAQFTGGWLALAITSALLIGASLLITESIQPIMLAVICAPLCVRAIRRGLPLIAPVALLAVAGIAVIIVGESASTTWTPVLLSTELLEASFNVALVTLFVVVRPPLGIWIPPVRRWRFEDVLFLASAAALVPAAILMRGVAPGTSSAMAWGVVASLIGLHAAIAIAAAAAHRLPRKLRMLLKAGRLQSARRRSTRLPREIGYLFLSARQISDGLHRRATLLGMHLESARLRAGRQQQKVESIERERRRVELALQRATDSAGEIERRWRAFLDAVPEALFIADHEGRIEYVNEGVRHLLGHEPGKLRGMRLAALIPSAQAGADPLVLAESFASGEVDAAPTERIVRMRDSRGALREFSVRLQLFQSPDGQRLSIRLREAAGPLERARDHFAATMSHEIRTPLHGLMATLDMLRSEKLSPEGGCRLGIARTSAKTLIRITSDVLDLSRISAGGMTIERKPMSLDRLIADVIDEASSREEARRLELRADIVGLLPPAMLGDPLRIKQVLRNLISNALKFTAAGGVTVTASWSNGTCTIDVADTGTGIAADRRDSIFEAFVQGDGSRSRRQSGAGLGLAIARQLSEAMEGSLSLLHSGPRGSTFRIVLPLPATDEAPLDEQSQRNLPAVKGRILVAEDDEASRYVAQTMLESLDCPALIVANGLEALELMRTEEFDLALLDCELPGLDGYEVAARVRKAGGRHVPIIAMTAGTMSADRQRCFDAGMDDVLAKPFGKSALSDILGKWLSPNPGDRGPVPLEKELAMKPELDLEVFEELRQSLNWQLPPLRKIYQSIRESSQKAITALGGGMPADLELAQRRVHALQGGAGLVGARQIEHVAARLGQSLREGGRQEIDETLPLLLDVVQRFERVVDQRLDGLNGR